MLRFLTVLFVVAACMIAGSCDAPEQHLRRPWMGNLEFNDDDPAGLLQNIAERERTDRPVSRQSVPVPPGVDPRSLAPRGSEDQNARRGWRDAVANITEAYPWDDVFESVARNFGLDDPPVIPTERLEAALRHYIRGRQAAHEQQFRAAINDLERARELDPTSPEVLRELARSFLAIGDQSRATEMYVRLSVLNPNDAEAIFFMGMSAAASGDHQLAVATFGQRLTRNLSFDHDPAGDLLVAHILSESFNRLGYDRASIETARRSLEIPEHLHERSAFGSRVHAIQAHHGDLLLRIGDAQLRLDQPEEALEAYQRAVEHGLNDPHEHLSRVIYALLRLGRTFTAQHELLSAIRDTGPELTDRIVRLTAYVAEQGEDLHWLRRAVLDMHEAHPDEPTLIRAAASLLPADEALDRLRAFVERRPRDLEVVAQLLNWLGERDAAASALLTQALVDREPTLADAYVRRLVYAVPEPWRLYSVLVEQPESAAREIVRSRVHAMLESLGEAWEIATSSRTKWPSDPTLHWLQLDLVAELDESMLLDWVLEDGRAFHDPHTWIVRSRTHRSVSRLHDALEAGEQALIALDQNDARGRTHQRQADVRALALVELGRTHIRIAQEQQREEAAQRSAQKAIDLAEQALELDESRDEAYRILFQAYGPTGPLRDPQQFRQTAHRLSEHDQSSRVYALGVAEEAFAQGRYDDALEQLLRLYDRNPHDEDALELAVSAWAQADRLADAAQWLDQRLDRHPGNPALLERRVAVRLQQERAEDVIHALRDMIEHQPRNTVAIRLLERVYREAGRMEEALAYGEQRLLSRPRGINREVELAAMYGGVGRHEEVLERLAWVARHVDHAKADQLATAVGTLARTDADDPRHNELTITLATHAVEQHPGQPLQMYASALRAMSRQGQIDSRFDRLAQHAARHARGASGSSMRSAALWRDLAQALIDDGHAYAAARAVRARLLVDEPLDPQAIHLLGATGIAAYAAVPDEAQGDETVTMIAALAERDRLPPLFSLEGVPTASEVMFQASGFFTLMGRRDAADRLLQEVIRIDPEHGVAMNNIGYGRIERGISDRQTVEWIERAYELEADAPSVIDTMGWLRYRQGRFEDGEHGEGAVTLIERAHEIADEPSPETLDHLGDVYWRVGKHEEAIDAWRAGLAILEEPQHREELMRNLELLQVRGWGLLVENAETLYDQEYGALRERLREKVNDAEAGRTPAIALTFQEMLEQE